MEHDEAVEVGIVWVKVTRFVESVVVLDICTDLHRIAYSVLDLCAKGIERCAFGHGKFGFAVCHAFGADEVHGELHTVEEVGQLHPGFARERGFCAGAEDEETHRGWSDASVFPGVTAAGTWWVEGVAEGWRGCQL